MIAAMRARVSIAAILLFTLSAAQAAAEVDLHDGLGARRPIPYFPSAIVASNPALGVMYGSSVLGQLAGSAAVLGAGFLLNGTILPGGGQGTVVDDVGSVVGSPYALLGGTALFGLDGVITDREDVKDNAKDMALALGATYATVGALKLTVSEERPDGSNDQSFPSGHAAGSFAVATVLDREYGGATGWIAYGVATFVAASRVYGDHHWFQDVVAGAVIGHFYGWLFTR
jgi:membrane-associated phospholipid phosphatase